MRQMIETILMSPIARRSIWVPMLLLVVGCESDRLKPPPPTDPVDTYWDLNLDHHAVMLSTTAPYDTLTLSATPRNYKGEPLSGLPAPQYTSSDPERVLVTEAGTLVGVSAIGDTWVYATLIAGNLRHRDSVQVRVVDDPDPPVLTAFSIHPIPPDSAKSAAGSGPVDPHSDLNRLVRATDVEGAPLSGLLVDFRSSDTTVMTVSSKGELNGHRLGTAIIYATITAFGITRADTLEYRIGWPLIGPVRVQPVAEGSSVLGFSAPQITIGTGGYAVWISSAKAEIDVTFSDPAHVAPISTTTLHQSESLCGLMLVAGGLDCTVGGNFTLPAVSSGPPFVLAFRSFPVPGTYEYHSMTYGTSGRIVVVRE